jgi:hypothetical protein
MKKYLIKTHNCRCDHHGDERLPRYLMRQTNIVQLIMLHILVDTQIGGDKLRPISRSRVSNNPRRSKVVYAMSKKIGKGFR